MVWSKDDFDTWTNSKIGSEIDVSRGTTTYFVFLTKKGNQKQISPELTSESIANKWAMKWMKSHPNA